MSKKKKNKTSNAPNKNKAVELQTLKTPDFGHQITICPSPAPAGTDIDDWVRIAPTLPQRIRRFINAFVGGFILALLALCILYLPEYFFDYAHRSDEFIAFFGKFLIISVTFIGFAAAINTLLRDTVFFVSAKAQCIVVARKLTLSNINAAIRLKDMHMAYIPPEGIFKTAQINIRHKGEWITLAKSQGACEDIQALNHWLENLKK